MINRSADPVLDKKDIEFYNSQHYNPQEKRSKIIFTFDHDYKLYNQAPCLLSEFSEKFSELLSTPLFINPTTLR